MSTLLISDLHLSPERPAVTRAFFAFLHDKAREAEALYILGDLFESWIGDDDPAPLTREVIGELKQLSDSGTLLYFMHGNRDFMIARRFARETGCTLLPDHYVARLAGEPVLLMHGVLLYYAQAHCLCSGARRDEPEELRWLSLAPGRVRRARLQLTWAHV